MESRKTRKPTLRKTTVRIDSKKLERARQALGTRGIRDTIEGAFDDVLAVHARSRLVEKLRGMQGLDLDDPEVMNDAWR